MTLEDFKKACLAVDLPPGLVRERLEEKGGNWTPEFIKDVISNNSLPSCIINCIDWEVSEEGWDFWSDIFHKLKQQEEKYFIQYTTGEWKVSCND